MDHLTKQQISDQLRKRVEATSGNKVATALKISPATISHMLGGKWENISPEMWRSVQKQLEPGNKGWMFVETKEATRLKSILSDCKEHSMVFGICAPAGFGKSEITKAFTEQENVFKINCNEFFNRKTFLAELLEQMHQDNGGYSINEMLNKVIKKVNQMDSPVIILDEADKLSDQVLFFFITLYNALQDKCGLILIATDHLEKRIKRGVDSNKKGYKEIFSRLGRRFVNFPAYSLASIKQIVRANGIDDEETVNMIVNDCESDIRRVKRLVLARRLEGAA
ncbi:AAA family ATPase [Pedobacter zeae]|uniref:ORC1/DEAH AAA+ ATPase domain-containing protein n=1 Tax=Pedobacter zeae TaxID=1737356 RepID=A0A7W6P473_9SPHI|nr:AAA family ATPase [Pedobacter zeae]MBB4106657.1 hypothetical protein [Pedobacter zeae]GGH02973.1 hypothetical protein GCM10007422_17740 [Pedobacter zeae]